MNIPEEIFSLPLKHSELKTLVAIYRTCVDGVSDISTEELSSETGYSKETLRRAFRALESLSVIVTERTQKSYSHVYSNRYANNRYHVKLWSSVVGSSYDQGSSTDSDSYTVGKLVGNVHTSYVHMPQAAETEAGKMARWKGDEEDEVGGFGLFDEEVQEKVASKIPAASKRDPRTRGRRPEAEWTVYDVASEFSFQLGRKFPYIPGLVNVKNISGALRAWRNQYGTNATIEMEMLRQFFADERNYASADRSPEKIHLSYLRMFKTTMREVNATFDVFDAVETRNLTQDDDYLYSSDGRRFDNTLIGRKALARHEEQLKG